MPEAANQIICRSLLVKEAIPGENGGVVGYRDRYPAASLTIRLKAGRTEHLIDQQNRIVPQTIEGVHVQFQRGTLQVSQQEWERAGMTREACVAFLQAGAQRGGYEVVSEDNKPVVVAESDARKPIPASAK